jgi:leader peptidase (prepilin peptidase)/N-methyltransferase
MPLSPDSTLDAVIGLAGLLAGQLIRRHVVSLTYRYDDEADRPSPGARWWIPAATGAGSGLLAWRFGTAHWPLLLPTIPVAMFGPWLSAIDLDVCRLPNRILATHGILVATGIAAATILTGDATIAIRATLGGTIALTTFLILDRIRPDGLGWGDGKYAAVLGMATAAISLSIEWSTFMIASILAVATHPLRKTKAFPFGPWLYLGTIAALTLTA